MVENIIKMENIIKTEDFEIVNLNPTIATLYPKNKDTQYTGFDGNYLVVDFGVKSVGDLTTCNFTFKSDKYKITSTGASCGCTRPSFGETGEKDTQRFTIDFDSNKITKNVSKGVTLTLNNGKTLKFNVVING